MIQKILFSFGFVSIFGIVGGVECNTMTLGQAVMWMLIIGAVTLVSFVQTDWYEPDEKRKCPYRCGNIK